ncbi:recombinase RarA [Kurthia zopfii]|uniref:ATPase n=1 Tax=Kurthia zopfii TaxID=1650 RepID=A0A8B4QBR4_9BACL|nr:replication-associated recombination protein A [Kurthia zopfii]PWI24026.1 recombinase RarA [Kurthia zopfii]TDR44280.1 putative ATPase [Kurthia zopfii]GEK29764.1 recombinase RarA [Kurthia zopfii]STX10114.1 Replication-associated recombination protein A [Kurthia zopfii]
MSNEPLAYRMRPRNIDEIIGHEDIVGPTTNLYKMIKKGHVPSMLLYGPPGIGKTSLAFAIAGSVDTPFFALNATRAGKKDVEGIVGEAHFSGQVILFLDEIHRFNKLQQDTLLPHVENGSIILIGATTENPFHDVNPAIRSRCGEIKQLSRLTSDNLEQLVHQALKDDERGLGKIGINITEEQIQKIASAGNGDARKALNLLESVYYSSDEEDDVAIVKDSVVDSLAKQIGVFGDKKGDQFYNLISALQKSIRGSDVNAALYYLANCLENGDLVAVNRRLLVISYEDIGLADPAVGPHVLAAVQSAERLGMPEARIPLAQAVIEMCLAEKSNSGISAIDAAIHDVHKGNAGEIPPHLRDAHYGGAAELGVVGYKYPHNTPVGTFGGWVDQQYLPDKLAKREYYKPVHAGKEQRMASIYDKLKSFKK